MSKFRVFGIGLNKTGTTSLKLAFKKLGFRHFDRRPRVFRLYKQGKWDQIFDLIDDYETFEDWPWPLMVPRLLERYGENALFVLTRRRSGQAWLDSLKAHALKTHPVNNPRKDIFGYSYPHGAEEAHLEFYDRHLKNTRALFAERPKQMCELCWEEGQGWRELCTFLGMRRIRGDFPHANQSADAEIDPARVEENRANIAAQLAFLKKT